MIQSNTVNNNQIQILYNQIMEDSLQLPQDIDVVPNLQNFLSPGSIYPNSRQNTPPHSLAYSNSTVGKDKMKQMAFRSPIAFQSTIKAKQLSPFKHGIIKNNSQNYVNNHQYLLSETPIKNHQQNDTQPIKPQSMMIVKGKYKRINPKIKSDNSKSPPKTSQGNPKGQSKKQQTKLVNKRPKLQSQFTKPIQAYKEDIDPNERKTIQKNETLKMIKRIKQLQQAVNIQTMISQQLRSKLSSANHLIQSKLKQNDISYILKCKNSSRDLNNIDIFIEMNKLHKQLTQKNIIIDRYQFQIKQFQLQITKLKSNKKINCSPVLKNTNNQLNIEIQNLMQQRQSLMGYIDEQKQTLKRKIQYIIELQAQINRLGDKNDHYTNVQRPKIIKDLTQYRVTNQSIKDTLQQKQMEFNLLQLTFQQQKQQLKSHIKHLNEDNQKKSQLIRQMEIEKVIKVQCKEYQAQVKDEQKEILLSQVNLLKNQRDYYLNEYRKKITDSSKLYALQLKMQALQQRKANKS